MEGKKNILKGEKLSKRRGIKLVSREQHFEKMYNIKIRTEYFKIWSFASNYM